MLGRLARWLRLLGFDVLYYRDIDDAQLVRIAREQERTVITRDTHLLKRKGLREPVFITSDNVTDQLHEMGARLDFGHASPHGRCGMCNGILSIVTDKENVRALVSDHVYFSAAGFIRCEDCGKVYWKGTHYQKIREKLLEFVSQNKE